MNKLIFILSWPVILCSDLTGQTVFKTVYENEKFWYADAFILKEKQLPTSKKPIVIAIVDDGFRLSHDFIQAYLYHNKIDTSQNFVDDDNNGFMDDHTGWDVSDQDNDVSVPKGREHQYNHGTYIAGVITQIVEASFGSEASDFVKILPVKALSDNAADTYIKDGYKGIEYALSRDVDIICCAWNGGNLSPEQEAILIKAKKKGVLVIASAGNSFSETAAPPASHESVVAIAAIDEGYKKTMESNYGMFVDLSAAGRGVIGADVKSDKGLLKSSGTSAAVGSATACIASLKILFPTASNYSIMKALKNTAQPLVEEDSRFTGKLGAGFISVNKAYDYLKDEKYAMAHFNSLLPEGVIDFTKFEKKATFTYEIRPQGSYKGIEFKKGKIIGKPGKSTVKLFDKFMNLKSEFPLAQMPDKFFVPGNIATVEIRLKGASKKMNFDIAYESETIDSSSLFCNQTVYYELEEGAIEDGSAAENYTNYNSCKWIIKVKEGKRIHVDFDEMDTQANMDYVYLFDGETAIPTNIIAKFSGNNLPPKVTSRGNTVLVWFVTDKETTGQGWHLNYKAVD